MSTDPRISPQQAAGKLIDVHFTRAMIKQPDGTSILGVKGDAADIDKLILVSKHVSKHATPIEDEVWTCRQLHDTRPDEPKKGALFVLPLTLHPHHKYSIWNRLIDEIEAGEPVTIVQVKTLRRYETMAVEEHVVRCEEDIPELWPHWVKKDALSRMKGYEALRTAWLEQSVAKVVHDFEQEESRQRNLADEKVEWSVGEEGKAPFLQTRLISTVSNGYGKVKSTVSVPITSCDELTPEQLAKVGGIVKAYLARAAALNLKEQQKLNRKALIAGLKRDDDGKIRFQRAGEFLTQGSIWFPNVRPKGTEWQKFPIDSVPEGYWETFLSGLEGKLLGELLPYYSGQSWRRPAKTRIPLTERQNEIVAIIKAEIAKVKEREMWQGEGVDWLGVGKCVVFFVTRPGRPDLFVVDNPGPGAIYRFDSKEKAYALAENVITRTALIKSGAQRIIHGPGWKAKLAEVLAV